MIEVLETVATGTCANCRQPITHYLGDLGSDTWAHDADGRSPWPWHEIRRTCCGAADKGRTRMSADPADETRETMPDPLALFDPGSGIEELVAMVNGIREVFMRDGWTQDQAGDLVASIYRGLHRYGPPLGDAGGAEQ